MTNTTQSHTGRWFLATALGHLALAWLLARGTQFAENREAAPAH